jgi:hypothetical protein
MTKRLEFLFDEQSNEAALEVNDHIMQSVRKESGDRIYSKFYKRLPRKTRKINLTAYSGSRSSGYYKRVPVIVVGSAGSGKMHKTNDKVTL